MSAVPAREKHFLSLPVDKGLVWTLHFSEWDAAEVLSQAHALDKSKRKKILAK